MATEIQFRGGTTATHASKAGADREVTVDTDKNTLVVHDGTTLGGYPLAKEADIANMDNTSDVDKPVSTAGQAALDLKADSAYSDSLSAATINAIYSNSGSTRHNRQLIETDTPYTMINPSTDVLNVGGRLVEVVGEELFVGDSIPVGVVVDGTTVTFTDTADAAQVLNSFTTTLAKGDVIVMTANIRSIDSGSFTLRFASGTGSFSTDALVEYTTVGTVTRTIICETAGTITLGGLRSDTGGTAVIDISVKEIQPIVLPNAPFDSDTSHTTTTYSATQAVSKGDFVVSGEELVTGDDSTFDTIGNWTAGNGTIASVTGGVDGNCLEVTRSGFGGYQSGLLLKALDANVSYVVKAYVKSGTTGDEAFAFIAYNSGSTDVHTYSGVSTSTWTEHVFVFTPTDTLYTLALRKNTATDGTMLFDSISIAPYHDKVIATRDTADMHDLTSDLNYIETGQVTKLVAGHVGTGLEGQYYQRLGSTGEHDLSVQDYVGNTGSWKYLGTAENMSLQNPYFRKEAIDEKGSTSQLEITRQDIAYYKVDKTTYAYSVKTVKGLIQYSPEALKTYKYMDELFGTSVSRGLWEDSNFYYLPLNVFQRLNSGAYHPFFNQLGTRGHTVEGNTTSTRLWYSSDAWLVLSSYDSFYKLPTHSVNSTGMVEDGALGLQALSTNVRPDALFYDKVYINQAISQPIDAREHSNHDKLYEVKQSVESGSIDGIEGMVEAIVSSSSSTITYKSGATIKIDLTFMWLSTEQQTDGELQLSVNGVPDNRSIKAYYRSVLDNKLCIIFNEDAGYTVADVVEFIAITRKSNIQFRDWLHTDMIGNPSNYPQSVRGILASGKSLVGVNPLLVGQDGTNYTATPINVNIPTLNSKATSYLQTTYTNDAGSSYATYSLTLDSVNNKFINNVSSNLWLAQYTAKASSMQDKLSTTSVMVDDKVVASNSHSIYKGGNVVYSAGLGVPTGNGSNGFESKVMENVSIYVDDLTYTKVIDGSTSVTIEPGEKVLIDFDSDYVSRGTIVARLGVTATGTFTPTDFTNKPYWSIVGQILSTPQHSTIALDSSDSKASKRFYELAKLDSGQACVNVYSKEIIFEVDSGDTGLFEQLTDGTDLDDNSNKIITRVKSIPLNYFIGDE